MADRGSYKVTTIHKNDTTCKKKKEKESKLLVQSKEGVKGEGIQVIFKKRDKLTNSVSPQIPVVVKPPTFVEDMMS